MTATSLERSYSLPHGYCVTFCCDAGQSFEARWSPAVPQIRKARQRHKFLEAYQAVRRVFLQEVAATIGGNVLVVDTDRCMTCETILAPTKH
ncbi:hypothetical protein V1279_003377 [Bradyrhizobium sp. AZCC 1610]|uniref:hypothetical protein n=1 Tax=Bradyrhizobium sp. AZCC 1610 TaxID=3117020 RepID=UPI002FEEEE78